MNKVKKEIEFNIKPTENHVIRSEQFELNIVKYFTSDEEHKISKWINDKKLRLDSKEVSYRIINHWEQLGLISSNRPSGAGWRTYSIIDNLWIHIIKELRLFGYPLEKMQKVKESLSWLHDKYKHSDFPILEIYSIYAVFNKLQSYLIVFDNGDAEPVTTNEYNNSVSTFELNNHIKINLNTIIQRLFPKKNLTPKINTTFDLTYDEIELLYMIRVEDFESITVRMNSGKIERFEGVIIEKNDDRLTEIIKKADYQTIQIERQKGNTVLIKRTEKRKINK